MVGAPVMTERQLQALVEQTCTWMRLKYYHTWGSQHSAPGFPDLVIVGPGGILYVELKSARGRLTTAQRDWLTCLDAAGGDTVVWTPADWASGRIQKELQVLRTARVAR